MPVSTDSHANTHLLVRDASLVTEESVEPRPTRSRKPHPPAEAVISDAVPSSMQSNVGGAARMRVRRLSVASKSEIDTALRAVLPNYLGLGTAVAEEADDSASVHTHQ